MRSWSIPIVILFAAAACRDPAHDDAVDALGPEPSGESPGPLHRAGQPCVTCHGGSGPASAHFSMGGTVYAVEGDAKPLVGAKIHLVDARGSTYQATTNAVGNFFVRVEDWDPLPPEHVEVDYGGLTTDMTDHIGRDGSCADCHTAKPGPSSAGPVYLVSDPADLPEGGT